jgi:hypothetical protein
MEEAKIESGLWRGEMGIVVLCLVMDSESSE